MNTLLRSAVLVATVMVAQVCAQTNQVTVDKNAPPEFQLAAVGPATQTDMLTAGKATVTQPASSNGLVEINGHNSSQNDGVLFLNSLEGQFEGQWIVRVDRSALKGASSCLGIMTRYANIEKANFSAIELCKDGSIQYREKQSGVETVEKVLAVNASINSVWLRATAEEGEVRYSVGKYVVGENYPKGWLPVGDAFYFSDFMYLGCHLRSSKGLSNDESAKFMDLQMLGLDEQAPGTGNVAARGMVGRIMRRTGNVIQETGSAIGDATGAVVGAAVYAGGKVYDGAAYVVGVGWRVVWKKITLKVIIGVWDNTVGEIYRVLTRGFGGDGLPEYETVAESFHEAKIFDEIKKYDALQNGQIRDDLYKNMADAIKRVSNESITFSGYGAYSGVTAVANSGEKELTGDISEWAKHEATLNNLKLYMADAISVRMGWSAKRRWEPKDFKIYSKFELETLLTRADIMFTHCADAKTPDIFDVFVVSWVNDIYDCTKSSMHLETSTTRAQAKYDGKTMISQRDELLQMAAEQMMLMGLLATIDTASESHTRAARNQLFGKLYQYAKKTSDPVYANGNIPMKVYAALAMNRISRGAKDPVVEKLGELIDNKTSADGGFAEGTDYWSWMIKEVGPVYYWGVANGWITEKDVPQKLRNSAEWILEIADPSGYVPRVDDSESDNVVNGLSYWMAPFYRINKDDRFLEYTRTMHKRFKGIGAGQSSKTGLLEFNSDLITKFLTYPPESKPIGDFSSYTDQTRIRGGVGKVHKITPSSSIAVSLLAENGDLLGGGENHDQSDNGSIEISRYASADDTVDHLVLDPGYAGFNNRDGQVEFTSHNVPLFTQAYIGKDEIDQCKLNHQIDEDYSSCREEKDNGLGQKGNGQLSLDGAMKRVGKVFPDFDTYMCATAFINTASTFFGGYLGWSASVGVQSLITPSAVGVITSAASIPFASVLFSCGLFDYPDMIDDIMPAHAAGVPAIFLHQYSNGMMSNLTYDLGAKTNQRAVIQYGTDVLVFDLWPNAKTSEWFGVNYNLPPVKKGLSNTEKKNAADGGGWETTVRKSKSWLQLFPASVSTTKDLNDDTVTFATKNDVKGMKVYRVRQIYQPTTDGDFGHLSIFQVRDSSAKLSAYSVSKDCQNTQICVEKTTPNGKLYVFLRAGYPTGAKQTVKITPATGKEFTTDAAFGVMEWNVGQQVIHSRKLYHVSMATFQNASLLPSNSGTLLEFPARTPVSYPMVKVGNDAQGNPLLMDATEVTQEQYQALMGRNPSMRPIPELPVTDLSWYDAIVYANRRSKKESLDSAYTWTKMNKDGQGNIEKLVDLKLKSGVNGYRLPKATEWKMGATFAEPTQWNYETAAGMAHRVPSSVALNRLADYWGNVSEMLWEGGDKGDCIGGSANDSAKAIATTFCTLEMYQTDTLRGFRLVRSDVQQAIKVSPRQQTWKSNGIAVPVVTVPQTGLYALQVKGSGYRTLETGLLDSREFSLVGDLLQVDLRIPAEQPHPWWIGEMALQIDIPSAGIYSQELGRRSLQGFVYGDWNTLDFALNSKVQTALLGTHPDVRFKVILNVSSPGEWLLGNFRMAGNLTARSGQVLTPSLKQQEEAQTLGFELASGWTTPSGAVSVTQSLYSQGSAALQVSASGWMPLTSARINSATLFHSSTKALGFDLFIPIPQPNPWWTGTVQVGVSCPSAGVYNQILGQVDLTKLAQGKFHHLQVPVPSSLATKLSQSYDDLQIHMNLNTASQAGPFVFDGLQGE